MTLTPTSEQLSKLPLRPGSNTITFKVRPLPGTQPVQLERRRHPSAQWVTCTCDLAWGMTGDGPAVWKLVRSFRSDTQLPTGLLGYKIEWYMQAVSVCLVPWALS